MGGSYAPINLNYVQDQDSSIAFQSASVDLTKPVSGIQYQLAWASSVVGVFTFQATIFDDKWEDIPNCVIEVRPDGENTGHRIVTIPAAYLLCKYIRFIWTPASGGSSGNFDAAIRISST